MSEYYIPAGAGDAEYIEKRSRFIGAVRCVETEEEARAFIESVKKTHYDARHNCWCYIIKEGAVRYSDDGEPQGTAGIPMLEVFKREGVTNVVCVVTRYFGGVLLGAGGLLRAYTKSAKDALDSAGVAVVRRWVELKTDCPYSLLEKVKNECAALDGFESGTDYAAQVSFRALLPEENAEAYTDRIREISAGACRTENCGEAFRPVRIK